MPRVTVIVLTNSRARRHDVRRNDYKYFFLRIKRRPCWLAAPVLALAFAYPFFFQSMTGIFTIRVLLLQFFHAWILHNCGAQISLDETLLTAELLKYFLHEACVGWSSSISAIETCFFSGCCPPHWKHCRPRRSNQFGRSFCNTKRVLLYRVAISLKERRTHPQRYRVAEI